MKKIEEAAFEIYPVTGDWRQDTTNADRRTGFKAGARYVLDAMASEMAADVGVFAAVVHRLDVKSILAAVRKGIEGE